MNYDIGKNEVCYGDLIIFKPLEFVEKIDSFLNGIQSETFPMHFHTFCASLCGELTFTNFHKRKTITIADNDALYIVFILNCKETKAEETYDIYMSIVFTANGQKFNDFGSQITDIIFRKSNYDDHELEVIRKITTIEKVIVYGEIPKNRFGFAFISFEQIIERKPIHRQRWTII